MKEEHEYRQDIQKAQYAKEVLQNPLVIDYFESKRKTIMHNLETCKHWKDTDERDALLNMLHCLADFEKDFNHVIRTGKKAEMSIADLIKSKLRRAS